MMEASLGRERETALCRKHTINEGDFLKLTEFKAAGTSAVLLAFQALDGFPDALDRFGEIAHRVGIGNSNVTLTILTKRTS